GLHLHARRRRAQAACRQHPLAFDLDHADAAIAVGAIAGRRRVAKMRQLDAEPGCGAENRLAGTDIDLAPVDAECVGLWGVRVAHQKGPSITICPAAWSVRPENILARKAKDLVQPVQARRSKRPASGWTVPQAGPGPTAHAP